MNHSSEHLKVIYTKCSMFYAITRINYQFKRSELKNVQKLVKQTFFLQERTGNVHFCTTCEIIFLVGGP